MAQEDNEGIRLNKFIAQRLSIGRRSADDLIEQGKVRLNGQLPPLGARVRPGDDVVADGTQLDTGAPQFLYVLLNKPTGYVCSRRQQGDTPTIFKLLPATYHHLKPVGRLDKDSSGILLLTNDGDLAHQLTHPSFAKIKKYEVTLNKPLQPLHRQMIGEIGLQLPDGASKLGLERMTEGDDARWIVTMHEGRNRQIRRTFAALGYDVMRLNRTQFGRLSIHALHGARLLQIEKDKIV